MFPSIGSKTGARGEFKAICSDRNGPFVVLEELEVIVWMMLDVIVSIEVKVEVAVDVTVEVAALVWVMVLLASNSGATRRLDEINTAAKTIAAATNL